MSERRLRWMLPVVLAFVGVIVEVGTIVGTLVIMPPRVVHAANGNPGFPTAGITAQGYNKDAQLVRFRAGLTTADSNSLSTVIATAANSFQLNGRPTVMVSCRFATSSTNTCKLRVVWIYQPNATDQYVLGISQELTATATAIQDAANPTTSTGAGYYIAPDLVFDGHGATNCYIVLTSAPSGGGAVDFWVGSE